MRTVVERVKACEESGDPKGTCTTSGGRTHAESSLTTTVTAQLLNHLNRNADCGSPSMAISMDKLINTKDHCDCIIGFCNEH